MALRGGDAARAARALRGRESLTDEEVAQIQKVETSKRHSGWRAPKARRWGRRSVGESPIRGSSTTASGRTTAGPGRSPSRRRSSSIRATDNPVHGGGKKANQRAGARYGVGPYESFLDPDTGERCLTDGVTALMWQGPNGGTTASCRVRASSRSPRGVPGTGASSQWTAARRSVRQWFGSAVGKWEGKTFVVDTTNFVDRTNYEWAAIFTRPSESLHLVERFKRTGANTIEYRITVEDPTTFERPWTARHPDHEAGR